MAKNSTTISYSVRPSKKNKKGESPIGVTISSGGQRIYMSTGRFVPASMWDGNKQRVRGTSDEANVLNEFLTEFKNKIYRKEIELIKHGYVSTPELLKDAMLNNVDELQQHRLMEVLREHNEEKKKLVGISIAEDTYSCYLRTETLLKQFLKEKYKRDDIYLHELTIGFIEDFHTFLLSRTKMRQNTTCKHLKFLKKIVNDSVARGYLPANKLAIYRVERTPTEPVFLTEEELRRIINFETPYKHLERTRDAFLFSCFTGLAYIDIKTLTKEHIERGEHGKMWIKKHRIKTGVLSRIPILPMAKMIMDKYKDTDPNFLIPIQGVSEVNEYIKSIAVLCGIDKHLVFHSARHTFATTVTLSNNISLEVVSKMMGHTNTRMTTHYAKLLDKCIEEQMEKIDSLYPIE